jgi:hypothetical protein
MTTVSDGVKLVGHSGNDEITTPDGLYLWLHKRFQFDYDAAAGHENARCKTYSTVEGTFRKGAEWGFDGPAQIDSLDGLRQDWDCRRVFVNPPYSRPLMGQFIDKAIAERNNAACIVMLVKFDPSTENGRKLMAHFHLEYLPRIKYGGMESAATFPSVIAIARPDYGHWRAA